jgi:hypothetical protein
MSEKSAGPLLAKCFLGLAEDFLSKIMYLDEILPKEVFLATLLIRQVQTSRIVAMEHKAVQGSLFPIFFIST